MGEAKVEPKVEAKVSSRSMEAAMVARLFKDAMESGDPIVAHFVWERDNGQSLDMGRPKVHPSFPNPEVASRRLADRIGQWVSGDKPGLDRNALARLEIPGAPPFDMSMESFEKAALSDAGELAIGVGHGSVGGREPMEITRIVKLTLMSSAGARVGRKEALLPIREIIQIQKREREAQAKRLDQQERSLDDDDDDVGRRLAREEERQWAEADPPQAKAPLDRAQREMEIALGAVGREMSASLKAQPLPVAEVRKPKGAAPAKVSPERARAMALEEAKAMSQALSDAEEDEQEEREEERRAEEERRREQEDEERRRREREYEAEKERLRRQEDERRRREQQEREEREREEIRRAREREERDAAAVAAAKAQAEKEAAEAAAKAHAPTPSQVRTESASPKLDVEMVKAVFPALPGGRDEIHLAIAKEDLFSALEALEEHGEFEIRLASKGSKHLVMGICVPAGSVALLADFIAAFAKGGVMIKRSHGEA